MDGTDIGSNRLYRHVIDVTTVIHSPGRVTPHRTEWVGDSA